MLPLPGDSRVYLEGQETPSSQATRISGKDRMILALTCLPAVLAQQAEQSAATMDLPSLPEVDVDALVLRVNALGQAGPQHRAKWPPRAAGSDGWRRTGL